MTLFRLDLDDDLLRDRVVQIDFHLFGPNRHYQAVTSRQVVTLQRGPRAPPSGRWVHRNETSTGEFGGSPLPNILMQGASVALPIAQVPIWIFWVDRVAIIFPLSGGVDPCNKVLCGRIERALNLVVHPD